MTERVITNERSPYQSTRSVDVTHLRGAGTTKDPITTPGKHWRGPGATIYYERPSGTAVYGPDLCFGCGDIWPCRIVKVTNQVADDMLRRGNTGAMRPPEYTFNSSYAYPATPPPKPRV